MAQDRPISAPARRAWSVIAGLLPLALVLIAPALGVVVSSAVFLVVILWSATLLLGTRWHAPAVDEPVRPERAPAPPRTDDATGDPTRPPWLSLVLVLATLVTTTAAGAAHQGRNVLTDAGAWGAGLPYGLGLMLVLGVHEMGHFLAARHHGIRATLPYFIPVPFGLGTFGAFISLSGPVRTRRQLFDVGVAGPLAGLAVASPALVIGLQWSRVLPVGPAGAGPFGHGVDVHASVLLAVISRLAVGGAVSGGHFVVLHPLAFAGWLGVMLTALNLLPVGQLDGGHIAHALLGPRRADRLGKAAIAVMVLLGLFVWSGVLFWALFVLLVGGTRGARTEDDAVPLDGSRRALAWASFAILALILLPLPHVLASGLGVHCPYV